MRKVIFISAGILFIFSIAIVVAVLNINSYIRRNRDYLVQQAEKAVGRRIEVENIEINIWNGIGIRFENFNLADDPAFSSQPFVRAKDLQAHVKLLPLLRRDVQVKKLILNGAAINIIRNRQGVYNFSTIGTTDDNKTAEAQVSRDKAPRQPAAFLLSLLEISKGAARYQDRGAGTDLTVQQLDLRVNDLDFKRPFSINLAAAIFSSKQNVNLQTLIGPISSESDYSKVALDGEIDINPLDFNQLKKAVPQMGSALPRGLDVGGIFKVADLKFKGTLHDVELNGSIDGTEGAVNYEKTFQKPAGIPLTVEGAAHYTNHKIAIRQALLKLHTLALKANGDIIPGNAPLINLSFDSEPTSLEGWEKMIPAVADYQMKGQMDFRATMRGPIGSGRSLQIHGNLALQKATVNVPALPRAIENLNAMVNFSGQGAELKETNFNLGSSRIVLAAVIDTVSPLTLSYNLNSPELVLADLQASPPEQRKSDVLRNMSSNGRLVTASGRTTVLGKILSSEGRLYSMDYKNLEADLSYANRAAVFRNFRANVLNGTVRLTGDYGFDSSKFSGASDFKGIDLVQLYHYFNEEQRDIRGNLNGNFKLSGSGDRWQEIRPNLRGDGKLEVLQGTLLNFNIADAVLSGTTGIPGLANLINPAVRQKYPETFDAKDTVFKELQSQISVEDSRFNFKNLRIAAAQFKLEGDGWADFDRRVDIRGVVRFSPELSDDLTRAVRQMRLLFNKNNELEIPFILAGQMPSVRPRPDTSFLTKVLQRGLIQRGAEDLQEQLFGSKERRRSDDRQADPEHHPRPSSPEDLIRRGLEGLFGRQKR